MPDPRWNTDQDTLEFLPKIVRTRQSQIHVSISVRGHHVGDITCNKAEPHKPWELLLNFLTEEEHSNCLTFTTATQAFRYAIYRHGMQILEHEARRRTILATSVPFTITESPTPARIPERTPS